jgi:hypothetical protein
VLHEKAEQASKKEQVVESKDQGGRMGMMQKENSPTDMERQTCK